jgi:GAF domain-containing protein
VSDPERTVEYAALARELSDLQREFASFRMSVRQSRVQTFTRLIRAVRRLDSATSLTAILESLAKGTVAEAQRVAILIVEPGVLRVWGHFGFAHGQEPFDIPLDMAKLLTAAVTRQQTAIVPSRESESDPDLPSFMRPADGRAGLVAPLVVGGEVVALLYAEGAEQRSVHEEAAIWAEEVELLVRHAASRLENVTSERTVAVLTRTS